jgi:hypothetical protein
MMKKVTSNDRNKIFSFDLLWGWPSHIVVVVVVVEEKNDVLGFCIRR